MLQTHLTLEQQQQFDRDGYLVIPAVFDAAEVQHMRDEADIILELILNSSSALHRCSGRLDWLKKSDDLPLVRKIQPINDLSEYLSLVSNDARLLDPMRDIMGDEPILMEEKLNYKQPLHQQVPGISFPSRTDDRFPVHNDWAYYKDQNYPQEIISSALSIDECTPHNGPLHVWPGSHREHLEHEGIKDVGLQVLPHLIDFNAGVDVLVAPGSVMLFHSLLVHNSRSNESSEPRRLMIYSHYPQRYDLGHDVRNGPVRQREQLYEQQYREILERGEYSPSPISVK